MEKTETNAIKILREFSMLFKKSQYLPICILICVSFFAGLIELAGLTVLYFVIKIMIDIDSIGADNFLMHLLNQIGLETKNELLMALAGIITLSYIIKNIYILGVYSYQHYLLKKWSMEITSRLIEGYLSAPYKFILGYNTSTIIHNTTNLINYAISGGIAAYLNICSNVIILLALLAVLLWQFLIPTLMTAVTLTLVTFLQNKIFKKKSQILGKEINNSMIKQNLLMTYVIQSFRDFKINRNEKYFFDQIRTVNQKTISNILTHSLYSRFPTHIIEISLIIVVVFNSFLVVLENANDPSTSISYLGVLAATIFRIAPIMNRILADTHTVNHHHDSVKRLINEFNLVKEFQLTSKTTPNLQFDKSIRLNNISFSYDGSKNILNNVDLEINKGEMIGIIGKTGVGKTTLVDLIAGLLEPNSGELKVDEQIITTKNQSSWMGNIALVPQNIFLTDDTLINNIATNQADSKIDITKIKNILRDLNFLDFIESLPDGLNTNVGEVGKNLSMGQKQIIGIARAIYKDPSVLILDEPTSSLDLISESNIINYLKSQKGKLTIIIIAHRLSTIFDSDRVLYLKEGMVAGFANYQQLKDTNPDIELIHNIANLNS